MSYDPIEITIIKCEDPAQLELFENMNIPKAEPEGPAASESHIREVVPFIRSPAQPDDGTGDPAASDSPLTEASLKMARALTARSRALVLKTKYNPETL